MTSWIDGGAFDPRGPQAGSIAGVWWLMFWLGTIIYVAVLVALFLAVRHGRRSEAGDEQRPVPRWAGMPMVIGGGVVVPALVLVLLTTVTAMVRPLEEGSGNTLHVDVEGHRYWWDISYPEHDVVTANEVVIPTGEPVRVALTTEDVIHSFWVPQLAGKVDMIPGRTNELMIQADEPGEYPGYCAEYCGLAHSQMRFLVVALEPGEFESWVERQAQPAPEPETELELQGREAFFAGGCAYCHTIDGTNATSDVGPDLTHLAGRRTLAAGLIPNTRGHLAGWITDPQQVKPGNAMPATRLEPEQLQALLAYLETLE